MLVLGVQFGTLATMNIREESLMERLFCVNLLNFFGGLERDVTVSITPELEGFATTGQY